MGGSGGYRRLTGGSDDFSLQTHRQTLHHNIYITITIDNIILCIITIITTLLMLNIERLPRQRSDWEKLSPAGQAISKRLRCVFVSLWSKSLLTITFDQFPFQFVTWHLPKCTNMRTTCRFCWSNKPRCCTQIIIWCLWSRCRVCCLWRWIYHHHHRHHIILIIIITTTTTIITITILLITERGDRGVWQADGSTS